MCFSGGTGLGGRLFAAVPGGRCAGEASMFWRSRYVSWEVWVTWVTWEEQGRVLGRSV